MKNGKTIGLSIFFIGLLITIIYSLYEGIKAIEEFDLIIISGLGIMIIGFLILFISIILEQSKDKKKMKEEIKKEDLEPW